MDSKPSRPNEEPVQHQQPQQFVTGSDPYQTNRTTPAINQIGRRPSVSLIGDNSQQQYPLQGGQQKVIYSGAQQPQILQQAPQQSQLQSNPQQRPLNPQLYQPPRPNIAARGPAPQQQFINRAPAAQPPQHQQPISNLQQGQVGNRAPIPQAQPPNQGQGYQPQSVSLKQIVNPNQQPYPINRAAVPINAPQNITTPQNPQYRPAAQNPVRPINPLLNQSSYQKLPTHPEERRMATEVNQATIGKPQPNYTLSNNTDDVDDVVVRPMANMQMRAEQQFVDLKQQQQQQQQIQQQYQQPPPSAQPAAKPIESKIPPSVLQNNGNIDANAAKQTEPIKTADPRPKRTSSVEPPRQNGTTKPNEKANEKEESSGTRATSRASSHKSQDNLNQRSSSLSRAKLLERPAEPPKKISMNKIQVGNAPPPKIREVRSKIGSLSNASHKPGGGKVKIETKKLEFNVSSRIAAKNDAYMPGGGDKKIISNKLNWNAKSKIGSLDNTNHKPGGGDKKILNFKTDYGNAKPKPDYQSTLSASMSLPAECLVMSVRSVSAHTLKSRRGSNENIKLGIVRAVHPRPFRLY